jgi:hypothetical protein
VGGLITALPKKDIGSPSQSLAVNSGGRNDDGFQDGAIFLPLKILAATRVIEMTVAQSR